MATGVEGGHREYVQRGSRRGREKGDELSGGRVGGSWWGSRGKLRMEGEMLERGGGVLNIRTRDEA